MTKSNEELIEELEERIVFHEKATEEQLNLEKILREEYLKKEAELAREKLREGWQIRRGHL